MKKNFILALAVLCTANYLSAQNCVTEDFSGSTAGWTYSQGARVGNYSNPLSDCSENRGIITPGVGGNNPCNVKTPVYTSSGAQAVQLTFDILVFNANLKCNTWKDFDCETSVDVFYFIGNTKYTGITDLVLPPNGPAGNPTVNVNMPVGSNLPAGTQYQVQIEFKFKSGTGDCVQQNTKYVFDNFKKCEAGVIALAPVLVKTGTKESDFTISPNPGSNTVELKINAQINYDRIELLDKSGKILRTVKSNTAASINTAGLQKGTYLIRLIKSDSIVSLTKQVVIN